MKIKKVIGNIWNIRGKPFSGLNFNSYIIVDEIITVIDPVFTSIDEYRQLLSRIGLHIADFNLLLTTHWHADHASKAWYIKQESGASFMAHQGDRIYLESRDARLDNLGAFKDREDFLRIWLKGQDFWEHRPCAVDRTLGNDEIIRTGACEMRVVHTPGHTDGHCCFECSGNGLNVLFAGDMSPKEHLWYGYESGSVTDYIESLRLLMNNRSDIILSGHHRVYRKKGDIKGMYAQAVDDLLERDEKILDCVRRGYSTVDDIIPLYPTVKRTGSPWDDFTEYFQVLKHLKRLGTLDVVGQESFNGKTQWFIK